MRRVLEFSIGVILLIAIVGCDAQMDITPQSASAGAQNLLIEIEGDGTSFSSGSVVEFENSSNIVHGSLTVISGETATLTISIPSDESPGVYPLKITTPGAGVFGGDEVVRADFEVLPAPTVSVSPLVGDAGESGLVLSVEGTQSHFLSTPFQVTSGDPAVTIVSVTATDETHAEVVVDIDPLATPQVYADLLIVESDYQQFVFDFEVVTPRGISLAPDIAVVGEYLPTVVVNGFQTTFDSGTVASFSHGGIQIISQAVTSPTEMTLAVVVDDTVPPGSYTLDVDDGGTATLHGAFDVLSDGFPPDVNLAPSFCKQWENLTVEAVGVDTHFLNGVTAVSVFPATGDLTATLLSVDEGAQTILLDVEASPAALPGTYEIEFVTHGEHVFADFTVVENTPQVVSVVPSEVPRGESHVVTIVGSDTHFDGSTDVVAFGQHHTVLSVTPDSMEVLLDVPSAAVLGPNSIYITTGPESVEGEIEVIEGLGSVSFSPSSILTGVQSTVAVSGEYVDFADPLLSVVALGRCADLLISYSVSSSTEMELELDVPLLFTPGPCTIQFSSAALNGDVIEEVLQVTPGYVSASPGEEWLHQYLDGARYYRVSLSEGQIIAFRAEQEVGSILDLVLSVAGDDANFVSPLAANDDESLGTWDSLLVFQAPEEGDYYVRVKDRLGVNTGYFSFSLGEYLPLGQYNEVEPNDSPLSSSLESATDSLRWGRFDTPDDVDCYSVPSSRSGEELHIKVIARSLSPYAVSGAKVTIHLYDGAGLFDSLTSTQDDVDPETFAQGVEFICLENADSTHSNTFYLLNVSSPLLINEVGHAEDGGSFGNFIEIRGEPSAQLDDCLLVGMSEESSGAVSTEFSVDLDTTDEGPSGVLYSLTSDGYVVIAHDTSVPGTGGMYIDPSLTLSPGKLVYSIRLECGGEVMDEVCIGLVGTTLCHGSAISSPSGEVLGRGFGIDTDDMEWDFMPQLEATPWERNLSEVSR